MQCKASCSSGEATLAEMALNPALRSAPTWQKGAPSSIKEMSPPCAGITEGRGRHRERRPRPAWLALGLHVPISGHQIKWPPGTLQFFCLLRLWSGVPLGEGKVSSSQGQLCLSPGGQRKGMVFCFFRLRDSCAYFQSVWGPSRDRETEDAKERVIVCET